MPTPLNGKNDTAEKFDHCIYINNVHKASNAFVCERNNEGPVDPDFGMCVNQLASFILADLYLTPEVELPYRIDCAVNFFGKNGTLRLLEQICDEDWSQIIKIIRACARVNRRERHKWCVWTSPATFFLETIPHAYKALLLDTADTNADIEDLEAFEEYLIGFCQT